MGTYMNLVQVLQHWARKHKPQSDKTSFSGRVIFQTSGLTLKEVFIIPVKICAVLKSLSKNFALHKVNDLIGGLISKQFFPTLIMLQVNAAFTCEFTVLSCMEAELNLTARNQPFQPQHRAQKIKPHESNAITEPDKHKVTN